VYGAAVAIPMTEPSTAKSTRITPFGAFGTAVSTTSRLTVLAIALNVIDGAPAFGVGHGA
jgi:hypothetical protein